MARRTASPSKPANLTLQQKQAAIPLVQRRIEELRKFDVNSISRPNDPRINVLSQAIDEVLVRIFGSDTVDYERYMWASRLRSGGMYIAGHGPSLGSIREEVEEGKQKAIATLEGIVSRFQEDLEQAVGQTLEAESKSQTVQGDSRRVFVVHGHDEGARESVARFIERIGFEPIILHERPNKGRTIITKFREEATDIGFAIVLMTPDDYGAKAGETPTKPRARQNVVFELGFFIGAFGPERVAALVKGDIERPSDFDGVVYIDLDDAGGWKQKVGRELQEAGFDIDWNKVMGS
jgi:predicted nucleotide-binding protein